MLAKLFATGIVTLSLVALAGPPFAQDHVSRAQAIVKCTAAVGALRGGAMEDDAQRAAAWKACMTKLGHRP